MELVFHASPLSHFARAGHLDTLKKLTSHARRITTKAVIGEIARGAERYSELEAVLSADWLEVVPVDDLATLALFAEYARRLGSGPRNVGEASVLAWAEFHSAIAIVDEQVGRDHGRQRSVAVHGVLWLVANGFRAELLDEPAACGLVDALRDTEARFPCDGAGFFEWARTHALL